MTTEELEDIRRWCRNPHHWANAQVESIYTIGQMLMKHIDEEALLPAKWLARIHEQFQRTDTYDYYLDSPWFRTVRAMLEHIKSLEEYDHHHHAAWAKPRSTHQ